VPGLERGAELIGVAHLLAHVRVDAKRGRPSEWPSRFAIRTVSNRSATTSMHARHGGRYACSFPCGASPAYVLGGLSLAMIREMRS
jgi:hypothetical protein